MAIQTNEVSSAIETAAKHIPDSLEVSMAWVTGILMSLGLMRKGAKTVMTVRDEVVAHNTMHQQLEDTKAELAECRERMRGMGEKLGALRDIELNGAKDVASIGIWVGILEERSCPCIVQKTCCAVKPVENLSAIYGRIEGRRKTKEAIFSAEEAAPRPRARRGAAQPPEAPQ